MAEVAFENVAKTYPNGHVALRDLDLAVADGELLVIVGPSGCGKSTALRLVAGLESPSRGRIRIGERDVTDLPPRDRDVAMVFQSYALYPHKSVRENLGFALRMRKLPRPEIARRVEAVAARLELGEVLERRPAQLSGGQRQRVALGRALVREPRAFLLDEPLSNLDARLRVETRAELARLHQSLGVTMLYVTHDQEEAMTLGDRIAVLREGRLEQLAPPLEVYRRPAPAFVADVIGVPHINWFQGRVERGGARIACEGFGLEAPAGLAAEGAVEVGVRPQDLEAVPAGEAELRGRVELAEALGPTVLVHARSEEGIGFRLLVPADARPGRGEILGARVRGGRLQVFDPRTGARLNG